jgi:hypothetical protein
LIKDSYVQVGRNDNDLEVVMNNGRPKRALAAIALGLCAVGVAVGSGADFSASSANPDNTFSAGTLKIDNSREGSALLKVANLQPGGAPQSGTVDIRNSGSLPGDFTLAADLVDSNHDGTDHSAPYTAKVWISVRDCGAFGPNDTDVPACGDPGETIVFRSSLLDMLEQIPVGRFGPGERHRFQFSTWLDATANNSYQGNVGSARFRWRAAQAPGA